MLYKKFLLKSLLYKILLAGHLRTIRPTLVGYVSIPGMTFIQNAYCLRITFFSGWFFRRARSIDKKFLLYHVTYVGLRTGCGSPDGLSTISFSVF